MTKYLFTLPIGDWSADGHGECTYVHVESNKPVEEVREAHFKIKEATGVDIHSIASEYEENRIDEDHPVISYLKRKRKLNQLLEEDDGEYIIYTSEMADLWIMLLQDADPTLELERVEKERIPMLAFYGFDDKGRHINFVGYGTF
jgi:hypothetical protein